MLDRGATFDRVAERVRSAGRPITYEEAIDGLSIHFRTSKDAVRDGLRERGVILAADDMLRVDQPIEPGDYSRFVAAVTQRLQGSNHPIHTDALLAGLDLPDAAIPFTDLAPTLKRAGLFHFRGAGWWTAPQWSDTVGNFYSTHNGKRVKAVMNLFNEYGWPLHAVRIAELAGGLVSASYFDFHNPASREHFTNVGLRMIVPASAVDKAHPVPMSPAMAASMLALTPDDLIARRYSFAAYGIALLLARAGLAIVKKANTRRGGEKQTQTVRMELTTAGRAQLVEMARGFSAAAHEIV